MDWSDLSAIITADTLGRRSIINNIHFLFLPNIIEFTSQKSTESHSDPPNTAQKAHHAANTEVSELDVENRESHSHAQY